MTRTIDAGTLTELQGDLCTVGLLVSLEFDDWGAGTVNITNIPGGITVGSDTYIGSGHLLSITDIEETAELSVGKVTVALSGVQSSNVALVLAQRFIDRPLTIKLAYLDDADMSIVGDPIQIFSGPMDEVGIQDTPGDTCVVTVTAANKFVNFTMPRGRHCSNEEQQALFTGDQGFEFCGVQNFDYLWGVPAQPMWNNLLNQVRGG